MSWTFGNVKPAFLVYFLPMTVEVPIKKKKEIEREEREGLIQYDQNAHNMIDFTARFRQ